MQEPETGDPGGAVAPQAVVVMGVSGSGKSTLGERLADQLGCRFIEGDAWHDPASIEKMHAGLPLEDEDRWPWLDRLGEALHEAVARDGLVVAACSALKTSYRRRLAGRIGYPTSFIMQDTNPEELSRRLKGRRGHYMPASLLESQLEALERPHPSERALILDPELGLDCLCREAIDWLRSLPIGGGPVRDS
jgi:gluconokinase